MTDKGHIHWSPDYRSDKRGPLPLRPVLKLPRKLEAHAEWSFHAKYRPYWKDPEKVEYYEGASVEDIATSALEDSGVEDIDGIGIVFVFLKLADESIHKVTVSIDYVVTFNARTIEKLQ